MIALAKDPIDIAFLDFSHHSNAMLRLAFDLQNELLTQETVLIGLLDDLDTKDILRQSLLWV